MDARPELITTCWWMSVSQCEEVSQDEVVCKRSPCQWTSKTKRSFGKLSTTVFGSVVFECRCSCRCWFFSCTRVCLPQGPLSLCLCSFFLWFWCDTLCVLFGDCLVTVILTTVTDITSTSSEFSEGFFKNSSIGQESITTNLSRLWADRERNLEWRYSDCRFSRFWKVGRIRNLSLKNQRERSIDNTTRRWIHVPQKCQVVNSEDLSGWNSTRIGESLNW